MKKVDRSSELVQSVVDAYGSLEKPDHSFMEKRYRALRVHPFVTDLLHRFFIRDETDLNVHASMHLNVQHRDGSMMACLSFVDRWCMLFRLAIQVPIYVDVLEEASSHLSPAEQEVMQLLTQYGFRPLSKKEASTVIEMDLFNTDREDVRVYHAIIADDGIVPSVLGEQTGTDTIPRVE